MSCNPKSKNIVCSTGMNAPNGQEANIPLVYKNGFYYRMGDVTPCETPDVVLHKLFGENKENFGAISLMGSVRYTGSCTGAEVKRDGVT